MSDEPPRWRIFLDPKADKALQRLSNDDCKRLKEAIWDLPRGDVKRLQGKPMWRLRVGDWRVIFGMNPAERIIVVFFVRPRGGAYKP